MSPAKADAAEEAIGELRTHALPALQQGVRVELAVPFRGMALQPLLRQHSVPAELIPQVGPEPQRRGHPIVIRPWKRPVRLLA
jgi:hypothetical protein